MHQPLDKTGLQHQSVILVVDDDPIILRSITQILKNDYKVYASKSASHAEQLLDKGLQPDLILLDIVMPEMNGLEFCQHLKTKQSLQETPIIFITSLEKPDDESTAFAAGAVDFLSKPISPAKVKLRVELHLQLKLNRSLLIQQNQALEKEQRDISHILEKMRHKYRPDCELINYVMSPVEKSSGDILLFSQNPSGRYFFLGDFTGHGLTAAVGGPSLARLFTDCVQDKELSPTELLSEINSELHSLLPTGMFVCACLLFICKTSGKYSLWNAGLPEQFYCGSQLKAINSTLPPLGILTKLSSVTPSYIGTPEPDSSIFIYTDGLTESEAPNGEMFGEERLYNFLTTGAADLDLIHETVMNFCAPARPSDDLTMAKIKLG